MKTSKLRVTGLCAGSSPGTGEFPAQMASNAENVSIWWRHHVQIISPKRTKLKIGWKCFCAPISVGNSNYILKHVLDESLSVQYSINVSHLYQRI